MSLCEQLDDYLDGALPSHDEIRFREHASLCDSCQLHLEAHEEFQLLVQHAKTTFDATEFETRLVSTVSPQDHHSSIDIKLAALVAVAALLVFALFLFTSRSDKSTAPNDQAVATSEDQPLDRMSPSVQQEDRADLKPIDKPIVTVTSDQFLAEPIESGDKSFTIFWLHPIDQTISKQNSSENTSPSTTLVARSSI